MAHRSQRLRLLDILAQIDAITAATIVDGAAVPIDDWLLRSAVERGVEIISEASRHLDPALKAAHPEVPWRRVADIGNWLRHAYERVEPSLILGLITGHFPTLRAAVDALLGVVPED